MEPVTAVMKVALAGETDEAGNIVSVSWAWITVEDGRMTKVETCRDR